jgi:hypothetical protein
VFQIEKISHGTKITKIAKRRRRRSDLLSLDREMLCRSLSVGGMARHWMVRVARITSRWEQRRRPADGSPPAFEELDEPVRLSGLHPEYLRAMQTHGLIVADHGSDMHVTGAMDSRWNNSELNPAFASLAAGDFEVIRLGWR